jgi:hypothetical protein
MYILIEICIIQIKRNKFESNRIIRSAQTKLKHEAHIEAHTQKKRK